MNRWPVHRFPAGAGVLRRVLVAGLLLLAAALLLAYPGTGAPAAAPGPFPTVTVPGTPRAQVGRYENPALGVAFTYPASWTSQASTDAATLIELQSSARQVFFIAYTSPQPASGTLEEVGTQIRDQATAGLTRVHTITSQALRLQHGGDGWYMEFQGTSDQGTDLYSLMAMMVHNGRLITLLAYTVSSNAERNRQTISDIFASLTLSPPQLYGISRDRALVLLGGESDNPRDEDPATSSGNSLVWRGLVTLDPQLQVSPDLAGGWDISADGTVYTFHLRPNARFHNGRAVTSQDVIYSWERAADPALKSDNVLTYLGDIVGVHERRAGQAAQIAGLKALDDHTLQVTIDAPKPYFLLKLSYGGTAVVDRANVDSGPDWYRTPNGIGPYKLIRWEHNKYQLYARNADFYLGPPPIPYIIIQLYAGTGIRLYETGDIDMTGVSSRDAARVRDPGEALHADLYEGAAMCTTRVTFDVAQPPFDDARVRQAFALAVDRQRYIDIAFSGVGIPAKGLYPPGLPGYNPALHGLDYDPDQARQLLAASRYGGAGGLPPITFTTSGFSGGLSRSLATLIGMWQKELGVTVQVENLEPDHYTDEVHAGRHGQLLSYSWCADYPDPENFADALFHSGAEQNLGHYANPAVDQLLDQARVERTVGQRLTLYQQAEQILVADAASLFLVHPLSLTLVKPYIKGYVWTPIGVPLTRYLTIDPAAMK